MNKKWEIVFDYLMYLIRENKVQPGEVLPSQNMLKTKFKYSEQPIRIAFNKLIELKIVKAVNGKGFVVQDKIKNNLFFSFRELFPNSINNYISFEEINCDNILSKESGYQVGERLYKFKCVRKWNTKDTILFQVSYVKKAKYKGLTLPILNKNGLMFFIENNTNFVISHSSKKIKFIRKLDDIINEFNDIDSSFDSLILDEGKVYDIFGEILEYRKSYYKPDLFEWNFIEWRK
ncbi:GntR family transcriptional regulator [Spiroplasma turonicum]|uniref:HTH gntR-type domain-containing protein n=1 Tax=Spiroplasma turonicum TaxID=216946 RepID=A0A0K1P683_9MOLU|nr:GntR family transcriptional regulator [Spiroplasma turonicum]AKU79694.1 hypothetical protein STURON_00448 [Spiroplasma turonicum]ALX70712.1 hypothetical protein STURO_v1c04460 [Spiroplasma turonicum]